MGVSNLIQNVDHSNKKQESAKPQAEAETKITLADVAKIFASFPKESLAKGVTNWLKVHPGFGFNIDFLVQFFNFATHLSEYDKSELLKKFIAYMQVSQLQNLTQKESDVRAISQGIFFHLLQRSGFNATATCTRHNNPFGRYDSVLEIIELRLGKI